MDLNAAIISGSSIAGIPLGTDINALVTELQKDNIPFVETTFCTFGTTFRKLSIADNKVIVVGDDTNRVVRLSCRPGYLGKSKSTFFPGMTVKQVCEKSLKQLLIHGMIVVDGDFGVFFDVPEVYQGQQFDDVDEICQLPAEMALSELHVMEPSWWR